MSLAASGPTFKPWTRNNEDETSLGSVLARIQLDRGHFRDITEQSLQEEIAAEGALGSSESEESEDEEDDDSNARDRPRATSKVKTVEDLLRAKGEMIQHIKAAQDDIDYARDFISLLVSKDLPRQAASSIAPALAKEIPFGTLGVDIWQRMPADKAREGQDEILATNVRMTGLQQSADSLLAAAAALEDNVRKETQYWGEILAIADKGWNVSKMPGGQHRLGVRYGFNESAPEFARRGLAALDMTQDGNIALDSGVGRKLKAIRAIVRKDGAVKAVSKLPRWLDEVDTTLEARIRHARDSLFDEELYHEMVRESRSLASFGVRIDKTAIVCPSQGTSVELSFDLVQLDAPDRYENGGTAEDDALAQGVVLAARLLLMQAHHDKLARNSEVPPPLSENRKEERTTLPILRPIMSYLMHQASIEQLNSYLTTLRDDLAPTHGKVDIKYADLKVDSRAKLTSAEDLITTFMQPWVSEAALTTTSDKGDEQTIRCVVETTLARSFGSVFTVHTPTRPVPYEVSDFLDLPQHLTMRN